MIRNCLFILINMDPQEIERKHLKLIDLYPLFEKYSIFDSIEQAPIFDVVKIEHDISDKHATLRRINQISAATLIALRTSLGYDKDKQQRLLNQYRFK